MRTITHLLCTALVAALCATTAMCEFERWYMNEEWYDWHAADEFARAADGSLAVEVHFVGPGAVTPRALYVRGDAEAELGRIAVSGILDHKGEAWECVAAPVDAAGRPRGKRWVRLAGGANPRGFQTLRLTPPPGTRFDYVCVSPNEEYITEGRAERWIRDHERGKEVRCGMPLGGIGAGKVEIARDGWLRNVTTNNNIDAPFYHPRYSFLAASIDGETRILRDEGLHGAKAVGAIDFSARFPIAQLTFSDPAWPADVKLTAWSPLIPGNVEDSALPAAIFEFALRNDTDKAVEAAVGLSWENMLGSTGRPQPSKEWGRTGHYYRSREDDGNHQHAELTDETVLLHFACEPKQDPDSEGEYVIATPNDPRVRIRPAQMYTPPQLRAGWGPVPPDEAVPSEPCAFGLAAAMSARVTLAPGESITIPIVLAWHMKHFHQMGEEDLGHYYARRFDDAGAVAGYVLDNYGRLFAETAALGELFDRSGLPEWLTDTLLNDNYVLYTDTWLTRDGRFSVNEGATSMYGVMGTMDQKLYASHSLALLFPSLQKQELSQFAALQNDNGGISHDLGAGRFAPKTKAFDWPDLCSAFSILCRQVYRYTGDEAFWAQIRPNVLRAIDALATTWDPEGLGAPGIGSTFDDEDSYRIFSYTTGLWLTVLRLGEAIAEEEGDEGLAEDCRRRYERAHALAMEHLWTGRYFRYGYTPPPEERSTDASHFSQLAGEFWARALGFDPIFDRSVRETALGSLFALHWNENFKLPPKIVTADGRLFPRDSEHRNAPVSWPMHSRALMCGSAFYFGQAEAGWELLRQMRENIAEANGPDPWDQSLYYDPITGRYDWGVFYMSAPASWLAYHALTDTHYDAVSGTLTLRPTAAARLSLTRFPVVGPLLWGMGETAADGRTASLHVERAGDRAALLRAVRVAPSAQDAALLVDGKEVEAEPDADTLILESAVTLTPGRRIEVRMPPQRAPVE